VQELYNREMRHYVVVSRFATNSSEKMFVETIARSKNVRRCFMKAEVTVVNLPDLGPGPSLGR